MKAKNQIVIAGILSLLVAATIAASYVAHPANAQTSPGNSGSPSNANAFGKGASQQLAGNVNAPGEQMGEHASSFAGEPRLGIGNVGNAICDEKLTPGEVVSSGILGPPIDSDKCP